MTLPLPHPDFEPGPRETGDPALLALAASLRARGDAASIECADELEAQARRLGAERDATLTRVFEALSVNHDVNNALVGIFGNAQLLGLGPAAQLPGVADRLAVITREAGRIKQAALRIAELKQGLVARSDPGAA
jgi:signal transduction histidine kinase